MTAPATPAAPSSKVRPFFWSVRRELWEHRSLYIAPAAAAAVILLGFVLSAHNLPRHLDQLLNDDPISQGRSVSLGYHIAAVAVILTSLVVGVTYCLGALNGERRDRSILFWKSLPVSDLVTVLSKAFVPLVVLPVVAIAVIVAAQVIMALSSTAILLTDGPGATLLWARLPLLQMWLVVIYMLAAASLWYAPIWAWLLLVSGWAKRTTFLWAFLPPVALCLIEGVAFQTANFAHLLQYRLGGFDGAFRESPGHHDFPGLEQIDPVGYLTTPGLWAGLVVAAIFLAGAVWQRRYREPI